MPYLKYVGKADQVSVSGFGHFEPGEEKKVDFVTAGAFKDPRCAAEGWVVRDDEKTPPVAPSTPPVSSGPSVHD